MTKLLNWIKSVLMRWLAPKIEMPVITISAPEQQKIIYIENKVQVLRGLGTVALTESETQEYLKEIEFSQQEDKHIQ